MKKNIPAILGGKPVLSKSMAPYLTLGKEERKAVLAVLDSGMLSGFIGAWVPEFYGGPKIKELERNWEKKFKVKYAVAMNSATSGLYAAIGAIGINPGDEIIVTSMTMTATVTGIIVYQAIPVFADICPDTFCIDPESVERRITSRTKAIIGVNIYGQTADWSALRRIAKKHGLKLIEDAAQSIGGEYHGRKSGTFADIGVYSLNRHKHIHCGEGGVCVTDNDKLAERLRLIRNHGEAVVEDKGTEDIANIVGFNYRMTEIEAAIANTQLKKLDYFVNMRRKISKMIINAFSSIDGISCPLEPDRSVHTYYYICFKLNEKCLGIPRDIFVKAMNAEGVPLRAGGYRPVYLQPMYQQKIAFGKNGFPFRAAFYGKNQDYKRGICPVAERMWFKELFYFPAHSFVPTAEETRLFRKAAEKILKHKDRIISRFIK